MADIEQQQQPVLPDLVLPSDATEQVESVQQELSIEEQARQDGWVDKHEFKGDPKKWRDAKTFVEVGPLYEGMSELKKSNKQLREELERDREHNRRFMAEFKQAAKQEAEARFNNQLAALREEKKLALREGETDRVVDLDEQMADLREQKKQAVHVEMPERIIPDPAEHRAKVQAFVERNKWYDTDEDMRDWADMRGKRLASQGIHGDEILSRLEKDVKEVFPQKFRNTNRDKPSAVEGSSAGGSVNKSSLYNGISEEDMRIIKTMVPPGMTEEKYIKDYKKLMGLK